MSCRNKAFTLVELMLVVAIIALLVGLVIMSMRGVRASATRSESLGALRQMALAYGQYTTEHRGRLMPGYIGADLFAPNEPFEELIASLPDGTELDALDSQSYVWRLAPYLDNAWLTFFTDIAEGARSVCLAEFGDGIYGPALADPVDDFGISERPSYGLNSIFVGGDSVHGGPDISSRHPWQDTQDKIAATRLSEVKNPARLIIFGPTAKAGSGATYDDTKIGYCEIRPPYLPDEAGDWTENQWFVGAEGRLQQTATDEAGLPIDRNGQGLVPVAHLDGSATVAEISTLSGDMRRWSPFEIRPPETQFGP
jgi:prepilin-type N-terminal cleavage/methylation domain-containing protein